MLQLVIQQLSKYRNMMFSSFAVFIVHAIIIIAISIILDYSNKLDASSNMQYSLESVVANQKFIEVELKEYPIIINEDDIIEIIEIKKEESKEIIEKEVTESIEKNTENKMDMPESSGISISFKQTYIGMVIAKLSKNKYYPTAERNRGREGSVIVSFTITPNGEAKNIKVKEPSKYKNLDKAAIETVNRSSPFPQFEKSSADLDIVLSLDYELE